MPDTTPTLGQLIRAARKRRGLTQAQAAELRGVTRGRWAQWETDRWPPSVEELREIAAVLDHDLVLELRDLQKR